MDETVLKNLLKYNLFALMFICDNEMLDDFFEFIEENIKTWDETIDEIRGKIN